MTKTSKSEYSKHLGVHERTVSRYISEGLLREPAISRQGRKIIIDVKLADQALNKSITTRKELMGVKALPPTSKGKTCQRKMEISEKAGTNELSFHEARTLTQRYKAALLKIELEEKTGSLVDAEQVKRAAFNKARAVRDRIMNLPDRIAPTLAAESDPVRVAQMIREELRFALDELSR